MFKYKNKYTIKKNKIHFGVSPSILKVLKETASQGIFLPTLFLRCEERKNIQHKPKLREFIITKPFLHLK